MRHINNFHLPYIEKLRSEGHTVKIMATGEGADFNVRFVKKLVSIKNLLIRRKIRRIIKKEKFDFIQPIKDIPRTLKGFPKNIVRIVKDPVKNNAQIAERRRDIYPYLYLFGALFLIMVIVMILDYIKLFIVVVLILLNI